MNKHKLKTIKQYNPSALNVKILGQVIVNLHVIIV